MTDLLNRTCAECGCEFHDSQVVVSLGTGEVDRGMLRTHDTTQFHRHCYVDLVRDSGREVLEQ